MPLRNFILFQLKMWSLSPLVWLVLITFLLTCGVFLNIFYFSFTSLEKGSNAQDIVVSFFGVTVILYFLLSPILLALQGQSGFGRQHPMLNVFALSPFKLLLSQYMSALALMGLFFIASVGMSLSLLIWIEMDFGIYLSASIGALLILNVIVALTITIGSLCKNQMQTLSVTLIVFLGLYLVELLSQHQMPFIARAAAMLSLLAPYQLFGQGFLPLDQFARLAALALLCLSLVLTVNNRKARRSSLKPAACTLVSFLVLISSSLWHSEVQLADSSQQRLTAKVKNSLSDLESPLVITAFTSDTEVRMAIENELREVTRSNHKIALKFSQAVLGPRQEKSYQMSTLVQFKFGQNEQTLHFPFARNFADVNSALLKLIHGTSIIVFSEGHGERSPFGDKTGDVKKLATRLQADGYLVQALNLDKVASVPSNTSTFIIASPKSPLSEKSVAKIWAYIDAGGALLWINDPDSPPLPNRLASALGIQQNPGVVVDPAGLSRGSPHPAITLIDDFEPHVLTRGQNELAAFPLAASFLLSPGEWQQDILIKSKDSAWLDTSENLRVSTENPNALPGQAQVLAAAFHKSEDSQRLIVIGGGHFLSDATVHNYGNLDLISRMIYWLSHQDQRLAPASSEATPNFVASTTLNFLMVYFFPWILPCFVFLTALLFFGLRYRNTAYAS